MQMQERIAEYVATLTQKSKSDYETPARECAEYFDVRGIENPTADDWTAFEEYFAEKYKREKGKDISPTTLQQNYVARGKAFYKWCAIQDGSHQTASLFEEGKTEASAQPEVPAECRPNEGEKRGENVRVNFLLSKEHHEALMSLALLEQKTLTDILTAAVKAHIEANSERVKIMREAITKARSK